MITCELSEVRAAMDASRENAKCLDCEVANKNAQLTRLESEAKSRLIEVKNLKDQLKVSCCCGFYLSHTAWWSCDPISDLSESEKRVNLFRKNVRKYDS